LVSRAAKYLAIFEINATIPTPDITIIIIMSNICNPIAGAEIVGREYLESLLPSRDNLRTNQLIDKVRRINSNVGGVDEALQTVKELHGPYRGASEELVSFTKNLFGDSPVFTNSILEIEQSIIGTQRIISDIKDLEGDIDDITFQDLSATLLRGYLDNVRILLPDSVRNNITDRLNEMPLFTKMSEALGVVYSNIIVPDNSVNMIDNVIGSVLDETGLSNVLGKGSWVRLLPEYAENFHNNVRLFQRVGSRVLPKCTYGKIFHKMDEPLAHIYNLAQDVFGFLDILDNRKVYLNMIFQQYGDLAKMVNNIYPMCHEYSAANVSRIISVGGESTSVDMMGRKTQNTKVGGAKSDLI